jgi:hypothetical protein
MPIKMGERANLAVETPVTTEWKTMPWTKDPDTFYVPMDLYYIDEKTVEERP